ncbi:hypothetical protein ElyMa_000077900 [Elysia marginata]|uniref:ALMS motif domain-containing protein n=1 Tax=Elysia marginata TaxID=1093978 RepID=A0AAV4EIS2_9GAST|nr:hypothetical protein ElyMa_000077900 [Elysia marginata]
MKEWRAKKKLSSNPNQPQVVCNQTLQTVPANQPQAVSTQALQTVPVIQHQAVFTQALQTLPSNQHQAVYTQALQTLPANQPKAVCTQALQTLPLTDHTLQTLPLRAPPPAQGSRLRPKLVSLLTHVNPQTGLETQIALSSSASDITSASANAKTSSRTTISAGKRRQLCYDTSLVLRNVVKFKNLSSEDEAQLSASVFSSPDHSCRPRRAKGKSESALRMHKIKHEDPEKYARQLQKAKERYQKRTAERQQRWDLGTRAADLEKEEYYSKKRTKRRPAESRTRTPDLSIRKPSVYHYTTTPLYGHTATGCCGKRRCDMTDQEKKIHDNSVRKHRLNSQSSQLRNVVKFKNLSSEDEAQLSASVVSSPHHSCRPRRAKGKSESALRRHKMKHEDPEKYARQLQKAKERYQKRTAERQQRWSLGTRAADREKEEYHVKKR